VPLRERAGHSNFAPQQSFKTRTSVLPVRADRLNLVYLIGTSAKLVSRVGQRAERAAWQQCDPLPIAILIYKRKCAS
jgi:hypothetical protein